MIYVQTLTLRELALRYADYKDESCLVELDRRDKINTMTFDEIMAMHSDADGQMMLNLESSSEEVPDRSEYVKGFEDGYRQAIGDRDADLFGEKEVK